MRDAYGSQWSRRSDPLRVLPYPLEEFWAAKPGEGSGGGIEEAVTLIPFASLVP